MIEARAPDYFRDYSIATPWEGITAQLESILAAWSQSADNPHGLPLLLSSQEIHHKLPQRVSTYQMALHLPSCLLSPSGKSVGSSSQAPQEAMDHASSLERMEREKSGEEIESEMFVSASEAQSNISERSSPSIEASKESEPGPQEEASEQQRSSATYAKIRRWFSVEHFVTLVPNSFSGRLMDEQEANLLLSSLAMAACSTGFPWPCFVPVRDGFRDSYWGFASSQGHSTFFKTDSVNVSRPPYAFQTVSRLLASFAEMLTAQAPCAAECCSAILKEVALPSGQREPDISLRRTFTLPSPDPTGGAGNGDEGDDVALWSSQWDAGCAWWPWASQQDPCSHLEVDVDWLRLRPQDFEAFEEADLNTATSLQLHALTHRPVSWLLPAFLQSSSGTDRPRASRQHLRLLLPSQASGSLQDLPRNGSLAAMLAAFWEGHSAVSTCQSNGELASDEWWARQGSTFPTVPSEATLKDVLRDIFAAITLPAGFGGHQFNRADTVPDIGRVRDVWGFSEGLPKTAPAASLAARLSMHALTFSNPRAVATLWARFVRELRFSYWEAGILLPRMESGNAADGLLGPDLKYGLLHQKLQLLNFCIAQQQRATALKGSSQQDAPGTLRNGGGVKAVMEDVKLLADGKTAVRVPWTQQPPVMTEDALLENQAAISALGTSEGAEGAVARLQGKLLASDMSAFKAANPGCLLADFIRWHSPRDWLPDSSASSGGRLSDRIGGVWLEIWESAQAVPAAAQKLLMDPLLEGERVMHWFESTVTPEDLWLQLGPVALSTSAALLAACESRRMPLIAAELKSFHTSCVQSFEVHSPAASLPSFLGSFYLLEASVVAAESLLARLPEQLPLVQRMLEDMSSPETGEQDGSIGAGHTLGNHLPFWDGLSSGQRIQDGAEKECLLALLQSDDGKAADSGVSTEDWGYCLQSEWVVEVEGLKGSDTKCRLAALSRPGEFRVSSAIASEY